MLFFPRKTPRLKWTWRRELIWTGASMCLLNIDHASQITCIYAQPDWHAYWALLSLLSQSLSIKIGKVYVWSKKRSFWIKNIFFSVYKFYLPLNHSGYWVYFVSLMCSHIVTFSCSHIQLKSYKAELNSSFLLPLVSARSFVASSSVFSVSTGTSSSGSSYRQIRKKL